MFNINNNQTNLTQTRCLNSNQFTLENLLNLCTLTDKIRDISQTEEGLKYLKTILSHKRAMLYFKQASTRTFLSFQNACNILGISTSEIRDTSTSSEVKGETELDTIKTFSQYSDLIIMRHPSNDFIYEISDNLHNDMRIINAGSGSDQHPTQALLDFYTIYKYGLLKGKKIAFVGDLLRGRTVRSLSLLLNKVNGTKLFFIAPNKYQIKSDILEQLNIDYEVTDNIEKVLPEVDVVYMVRLQDEYKNEGINRNENDFIDVNKYSINSNNINTLKDDAIILHPLPRREEISVEIDNDKRAKYWEQTNNGMWFRVALIADMFDVNDIRLLEKRIY